MLKIFNHSFLFALVFISSMNGMETYYNWRFNRSLARYDLIFGKNLFVPSFGLLELMQQRTDPETFKAIKNKIFICTENRLLSDYLNHWHCRIILPNQVTGINTSLRTLEATYDNEYRTDNPTQEHTKQLINYYLNFFDAQLYSLTNHYTFKKGMFGLTYASFFAFGYVLLLKNVIQNPYNISSYFSDGLLLMGSTYYLANKSIGSLDNNVIIHMQSKHQAIYYLKQYIKLMSWLKKTVTQFIPELLIESIKQTMSEEEKKKQLQYTLMLALPSYRLIPDHLIPAPDLLKSVLKRAITQEDYNQFEHIFINTSPSQTTDGFATSKKIIVLSDRLECQKAENGYYISLLHFINQAESYRITNNLSEKEIVDSIYDIQSNRDIIASWLAIFQHELGHIKHKHSLKTNEFKQKLYDHKLKNLAKIQGLLKNTPDDIDRKQATEKLYTHFTARALSVFKRQQEYEADNCITLPFIPSMIKYFENDTSEPSDMQRYQDPLNWWKYPLHAERIEAFQRRLDESKQMELYQPSVD